MKRIVFAGIMLLAMGMNMYVPDLLIASGPVQTMEELVNIRYLEQEKGIMTECSWDRGEIRLKKNNVEIKLYLNYPFLVCGDSVVRVDTPPFFEDGNIFIGGYTSDKIVEIVENGGVKTAVLPYASSEKIPAAAVTVIPKLSEERPRPTSPPYIPPAVVQQLKETPEPILVDESAPNKKPRKLIVLDPGHGGNDPGAIGPNGSG
jgi:N-acetylmuramoyl-L-alanine amidase